MFISEALCVVYRMVFWFWICDTWFYKHMAVSDRGSTGESDDACLRTQVDNIEQILFILSVATFADVCCNVRVLENTCISILWNLAWDIFPTFVAKVGSKVSSKIWCKGCGLESHQGHNFQGISFKSSKHSWYCYLGYPMAQADGTVNYIPANNKILNMALSYRGP